MRHMKGVKSRCLPSLTMSIFKKCACRAPRPCFDTSMVQISHGRGGVSWNRFTMSDPEAGKQTAADTSMEGRGALSRSAGYVRFMR